MTTQQTLMQNKTLTLLAVLVTLLLQPKVITAQEPVPNTVTISPAFLDIQVPEDQANVSEVITVTNTTDQTITLEVLPTNVNQQNLYGGVSFESFSGAASDTFSFLSFSTDRFVLDSQQTQEIVVTVENRTSLNPGGTYVAVIFRAALDEVPNEQMVLPAVSSLLLINKQGGEVYNLSLKNVSGLPRLFSLTLPSELGVTFGNLGNTHLQPRGTITFTGLFERLLAQSTVNESSLYILPGRERLLGQTIRPAQQLLPFDIVSVEIAGTSGNDRTPYYFESSFIYISSWFLISSAAISVVLVLGIFRKKVFKHENKT